MFNTLIENSFFLITSDTYRSINSTLFGYAITDSEPIDGRIEGDFEIEKESGGRWTHIKVDDTRITITQDYFCGFGLFVFRAGTFWAVSNSFYLLVKNLAQLFNLTVNEEYEETFIISQLCAPSINETILNEINELSPGEYLEIDRKHGNLYIKKYNFRFWDIPIFTKEATEIIDRWQSKYGSLLQSAVDKDCWISCDLSGGMDSRAVFSTAMGIDYNRPKTRLYTLATKQHTHAEDQQIADRIREIYNLPDEFPFFEPPAIRLLPEESIKLEFYSKFYMHEVFYYRKFYYNEPFITFNGLGGEAFRPYFVGDQETYMKRSYFYHGEHRDFNGKSTKFLNRQFSLLRKLCAAPINEAQKLYLYTWQKNHDQRISIVNWLTNIHSISPLMDLSLWHINTTFSNIRDNYYFNALIYDRFLPEINNIEFDGGRKIPESTWGVVKDFNKKFPINKYLYNKDFELRLKQPISKTNREISEDALLPKSLILDLWKNEYIKKRIIDRYGMDFYYFANGEYESDRYIAENFIIKSLHYIFLDAILHGRDPLVTPI